MTIIPENVLNYTSDIEDNTDEQNEKTNNKSKVNQNLINNQNVTKEKTDHKKIKTIKTNNYTGLTIYPHNYHKKITHHLPPIKTRKTHNLQVQTFNHHKIKQSLKKLLFPNNQRTKKTT